MKEGGISGRGIKEREGKRNYKVRDLGWGEGGCKIWQEYGRKSE